MTLRNHTSVCTTQLLCMHVPDNNISKTAAAELVEAFKATRSGPYNGRYSSVIRGGTTACELVGMR